MHSRAHLHTRTHNNDVRLLLMVFHFSKYRGFFFEILFSNIFLQLYGKNEQTDDISLNLSIEKCNM